MLLTRLPLMYPRRGLIARLACIKRAASVHPEPRSNSPLFLTIASATVFLLPLVSPLLSYHSSIVKVLPAIVKPMRVALPAPPRIGLGNSTVSDGFCLLRLLNYPCISCSLLHFHFLVKLPYSRLSASRSFPPARQLALVLRSSPRTAQHSTIHRSLVKKLSIARNIHTSNPIFCQDHIQKA